jgi:polysaccharide biosynthesis/export protein
MMRKKRKFYCMSQNTGFFILLFAMLVISAGCVSSTKTVPLTSDRKSEHTLGVGDVLRINVYGEEDLTGEYKIEPGGIISFPLIGDVAAAGFTDKELEASITKKLSPDYILDPKIGIEVLRYRDIYILGEVQKPGKYEYAPDITVLQAIATAGGYTYRANEDTVQITRHVKGALKTFTAPQTLMLKPGDTLLIKRRWF